MRERSVNGERFQWNRTLAAMVLLSVAMHWFVLLKCDHWFRIQPVEYVEFEIEVSEARPVQEPPPPKVAQPKPTPPVTPEVTARREEIVRPEAPEMRELRVEEPPEVLDPLSTPETPHAPALQTLADIVSLRDSMPVPQVNLSVPTPETQVETPTFGKTSVKSVFIPNTAANRVEAPRWAAQPLVEEAPSSLPPSFQPVDVADIRGAESIPAPSKSGEVPEFGPLPEVPKRNLIVSASAVSGPISSDYRIASPENAPEAVVEPGVPEVPGRVAFQALGSGLREEAPEVPRSERWVSPAPFRVTEAPEVVRGKPERVELPRIPTLAYMKKTAGEAPVVRLEDSVVSDKPETSSLAPLSWSPEKERRPEMAPAHGKEGDYYHGVWLKIERRKRYPPTAVRRRLEGRVGVRFVIETDGTARNIEILDPCPHRILNNAAVKAIRKASPFTPPPKELFKGPLTVDIYIGYELKS